MGARTRAGSRTHCTPSRPEFSGNGATSVAEVRSLACCPQSVAYVLPGRAGCSGHADPAGYEVLDFAGDRSKCCDVLKVVEHVRVWSGAGTQLVVDAGGDLAGGFGSLHVVKCT